MFFALQITQPHNYNSKLRNRATKTKSLSVEVDNDMTSRNFLQLKEAKPTNVTKINRPSISHDLVQSCELNNILLDLAKRNYELKKEIETKNELINRQNEMMELMISEIQKLKNCVKEH